MPFADKTLKCMECSQDFVYTAAEQELHQSLGYQNEPKRCTPCREAKRNRKGGTPGAPRPAGGAPAGGEGRERGPRGGGGRRENREGGEGPPRNGGGPQPREFFMAICNECGKEAQLPFKPRGDRPVFCGECFDKKKTAT